MGLKRILGSVLGGVVKPVADIFSKREDRRVAKQTGEAKLAQAKVDNRHTLEMTRAEWEACMARGSQSSWKDEFWTLVLAGPLVVIQVGALLHVFNGDSRLLDSVFVILTQFKDVGLDYGTVLYLAIGAAFGVRWLKR